MRVILDTNVFVSGVFFSGPPYEILDAWRHGKLTLVVSPEILSEYDRVGRELASEFPNVDLAPALELLAFKAEVVKATHRTEQVCSDPVMISSSPAQSQAARRSFPAEIRHCARQQDTPELKSSVIENLSTSI